MISSLTHNITRFQVWYPKYYIVTRMMVIYLLFWYHLSIVVYKYLIWNGFSQFYDFVTGQYVWFQNWNNLCYQGYYRATFEQKSQMVLNVKITITNIWKFQTKFQKKKRLFKVLFMIYRLITFVSSTCGNHGLHLRNVSTNLKKKEKKRRLNWMQVAHRP